MGNMLFHARVNIGEGAYRAGYRAGGDVFASRDEALAVAGKFGVSCGELQTERHRFGMDAMRAADGRRHFMLERAALDGGEQGIDIGQQQVGCTAHLDSERGVEHVGRCHALMHKAGVWADKLAQMRQEGDDIVLYFALNGIDFFDIKLGRTTFFPNHLGRRGRNYAEFG